MPDPLLATFRTWQSSLEAVTDLLDEGFLNVQQEQDGDEVLVIVDPGNRAAVARAILKRHGGQDFPTPGRAG